MEKASVMKYSLILCLSLLSGCKEKSVSTVKTNSISQPGALTEAKSNLMGELLQAQSRLIRHKVEFKLTGDLPKG